jgi:hypothetical protein
MLKKMVMILALVALVVSAGTVPAAGNYKITLMQPSVVKGTVLKAGDYKLSLGDAKVTITPSNGKDPLEVPVKVESVEKKFADTMVGSYTENGKNIITEIRLGGTTTKLIFNQ